MIFSTFFNFFSSSFILVKAIHTAGIGRKYLQLTNIIVFDNCEWQFVNSIHIYLERRKKKYPPLPKTKKKKWTSNRNRTQNFCIARKLLFHFLYVFFLFFFTPTKCVHDCLTVSLTTNDKCWLDISVQFLCLMAYQSLWVYLILKPSL